MAEPAAVVAAAVVRNSRRFSLLDAVRDADLVDLIVGDLPDFFMEHSLPVTSVLSH